MQEEKKISLNVGIGTGGTMNDAEMNARRALDFSLKNAKQEIFWIDADQTQHGPLGRRSSWNISSFLPIRSYRKFQKNRNSAQRQF
ncbi:MAG: hypothetical protein ACLR2O_10795 [Coprococcus sp.]